MDEKIEAEIGSNLTVYKIDYLIANLMVFYKGAVDYNSLNSMPLDELLQLNDFADKINRDIEQSSKKASRR